jgi:hypothetical protein
LSYGSKNYPPFQAESDNLGFPEGHGNAFVLRTAVKLRRKEDLGLARAERMA